MLIIYLKKTPSHLLKSHLRSCVCPTTIQLMQSSATAVGGSRYCAEKYLRDAFLIDSKFRFQLTCVCVCAIGTSVTVCASGIFGCRTCATPFIHSRLYRASTQPRSLTWSGLVGGAQIERNAFVSCTQSNWCAAHGISGGF